MKLTRSALAFGECVAVAGGIMLALSLLMLPWFQLTVDGFTQPGTSGGALELLDGLDVVLLAAALVPLIAPALARGEIALRVIAIAGALAATVTLYVILAPPAPDPLLAATLESSADLGFEPRFGAFIGLIGSLAILAGAALELIGGRGTQPPSGVAPQQTPAGEPASGPAPIAAQAGEQKPARKPRSALATKAKPKTASKGKSATKARSKTAAKDKPAPKTRQKPKSATKTKSAAKGDRKSGSKAKASPRPASKPKPRTRSNSTSKKRPKPREP